MKGRLVCAGITGGFGLLYLIVVYTGKFLGILSFTIV